VASCQVPAPPSGASIGGWPFRGAKARTGLSTSETLEGRGLCFCVCMPLKLLKWCASVHGTVCGTLLTLSSFKQRIHSCFLGLTAPHFFIKSNSLLSLKLSVCNAICSHISKELLKLQKPMQSDCSNLFVLVFCGTVEHQCILNCSPQMNQNSH